MDYLERVNKVISFIEANLNEEIGLPEVSRIACFSPFHFHRIFLSFTGESVASYIRKRRLTKAAEELLTTNKRIIEIALDNFYESQEAFSRAFFNQFKLQPFKYRKLGKKLEFYQKKVLDEKSLEFLQKGVTMNPKIVDLSDMLVVGMARMFTINTNPEGKEIAKLWQEFIPRIPEISNRIKSKVALGVCGYVANENFSENTPFEELVSVIVDKVESIPEEMKSKKVKGGKYAVFTHKGKIIDLQKTYDYIYKTWLPKSGYEMGECDDFEWYDERFKGDSTELEFDIYIPIK